VKNILVAVLQLNPIRLNPTILCEGFELAFVSPVQGLGGFAGVDT
jgi:hypothetical protein